MARRCGDITLKARPPSWRDTFVSAYASAHPWEDFAETWAHYLHIVDTLEMAALIRHQGRSRRDRRSARIPPRSISTRTPPSPSAN